VELRVSDTGIGIPEEEIPNIFNEFYRAPNAREFAKEGTGLGLSIVKSIVDGLQGSIQVESTVGKGTTFIVSLPMAHQDPAGGNPAHKEV
jgi:signal transduction histidine kinase